jgi:DNA polymerase IV
MSRTIFHLDLDAFFVAVERRLDPTLAGKPVIVSAGTGRSVVAAASYEARVFGVHSAMPFAHAQRLCPQAVVLPGNFREYQKASRAFFAILGHYSPRMEPLSLDEGYLDYTGCERLLGAPLAAAETIQKRVAAELGLDASVGVAASKAVAKIASDLSKPAGLLQVLPGHEAAFLAPLPVGRLWGVGPKSEAKLRAYGLRTIGDVARLPRGLLGRAFGRTGYALQDLARGIDPSPVQAREQAGSVSNEETFQADTTSPEFLRHALYRLVCEVGYRLRRAGLRARTACVKLRYADLTLHTRSLTLEEPTDLDRLLFAAAADLLARAWDRRVRVRLVGFAAQNLESGEAQLELTDDRGWARWGRLQTAADRVRKRYGYDSVAWASLLRREVE